MGYPQTAQPSDATDGRASHDVGMAHQVRRIGDLPLVALGRADAIQFQLECQDGVISRRQLSALGARPADIEKMLRHRDLVRIYDGVFVNHTGSLSWTQRAWANVMRLWPAALDRESVWRETPIIHVAIDRNRSLATPPGVELHRLNGFDELVHWLRGPPRIKVPHAALNAAAAHEDTAARVAMLSDVVQRRLTGYRDIQLALAMRPRMRGRAEIELLLADLSNGTNSVLEHAYLTLVERPHGLPTSTRQFVSRAGRRRAERDVFYREFGLIVELDGRTFHDNATARDRDMTRDLDAAIEEAARTVRLGYGQVTRDSCSTAVKVGRLLQQGGWVGDVRRCPAC